MCSQLFALELFLLIENRLLKSFLEDEKAHQLYKSYLENPNIQTKDTLEKMFKIHFRKIQLLSYFSRILHFESQRYDKKNRHQTNLYQLVLDKESNEGDVCIIDMIPDESVLDDFEMISSDAAQLESFFEDEKLYSIVSNLTQRQKYIIHALFIENQSESEVAERLSITKQAVNKVKNQTLKKIKQRYID
jgi:RNA polymerase sigma factor (sigma-70 family)